MQGAQVQFLVGEHATPHGQKKKKKKFKLKKGREGDLGGLAWKEIVLSA